MLHRFFVLAFACVFSYACHAIDIGNENPADKADRFDFEEFHKEKGITLWDDKKGEGKKDKKEITVDSAAASSAVASETRAFEKGEVINVRAAYKLGNDPASRAIQSLYEAMEALEKQLKTSCPAGWVKEKEWRIPQSNHFYLHYQVSCL